MTTDTPTLRWYGERGIVNALVVHVGASPVDRVPALLWAIQWADGSRPDWLDSMRSHTLMVEWGLADFGNPDLILVAKTDDGPRCVFVEAKVGPYLSSMMPNRVGMRGAGFNSSINGQLALKFRFASALECASTDSAEIAEPAGVLEQYQTQVADPRQSPRRLVKASIVDVFRELDLLGVPEERFAYVALTWDAPHRAFFHDLFVAREDGLPRFIRVDGRDAYADAQPRLGWLGYQRLQSALALHADAAYASALTTMQRRLEPDRTDYAVAEAALRLSATPESIAEAAAFRALFPGYEIVQSKASYSVREGGQTIAKIIPRRNEVFVGIRDLKRPHKWFSGPIERVSIQGVEFFGVSVPVEHPDDAQLAVLVGGLSPHRLRQG